MNKNAVKKATAFILAVLMFIGCTPTNLFESISNNTVEISTTAKAASDDDDGHPPYPYKNQDDNAISTDLLHHKYLDTESEDGYDYGHWGYAGPNYPVCDGGSDGVAYDIHGCLNAEDIGVPGNSKFWKLNAWLYTGIHSITPVYGQKIWVNPGQTVADPNGNPYVVQKGDTIYYYRWKDGKYLGSAKAGKKFEVPTKSMNGLVYDLVAAQDYADWNSVLDERIRGNECALFASAISVAAGISFGSVWASYANDLGKNAGDLFNANWNPVTLTETSNTSFFAMARERGLHAEVNTNEDFGFKKDSGALINRPEGWPIVPVNEGELDDDCWVEFPGNENILHAGDVIGLAPHHCHCMTIVDVRTTSSGKVQYHLRAHSTGSKGDLQRYIWSIVYLSDYRIVAVAGGSPTGDLHLNKTNNGKALANIQFTLKDGNTVVAQGKTDANGDLTLSDIPYGTYQLYEDNIPVGMCYINDEKQTVDYGASTGKTVEVDENSDTRTYYINNENIKAPIKIKKVEEGTSKGLAGAVFSITNSAGQVVATLTTNANGEAQSEPLAYGTYTVREVTAPAHYAKSETVQTVNITRLSGSYDTVSYSYTFGNEPLGEIDIEKKNADTNENLSGIKFTLKQGNTTIATATTNAQGQAKFENLHYGNYTLYEDNIPTGMCYINDQKRTIEYGSSSGINYTINSITPVQSTIYNTPIKAPISIEKTNSRNGHGVLGAKFDIINASGAVVATLTTDANGKATSAPLAYGKYTVKETFAPEGYATPNFSTEVNITEHNHVYKPVTYGVSLTNKPVAKVSIPVRKTLSFEENNTEADRALLRNETYTFEITPASAYINVNGNMVPVPVPNSKTVTITGEGTANFREMEFAEPGVYTYTVKEIKGDKNINYDPTTHVVNIYVTTYINSNGEELLRATRDADGIESGVPAFVNNIPFTDYGYADVRLKVAKTLNITAGSTLLNPETFTFELETTDNSIMPMGTTGTKATISVVNDGTETFLPIRYDYSAPNPAYNGIGRHHYTLREIVPDQPKDGMTYDGDIHEIIVEVYQPDATKNEIAAQIFVDGQSVANGEIVSTEIFFTNTFTTPSSADAEIVVTKEIRGNARPEGEEVTFEFTIERDPSSSSDTPMPSTSYVTIKDEGKARFTGMEYTRPGTYRYIVKETAKDNAGYTWDKSEWRVSVSVENVLDASGNTILKAAAPRYEKTDGASTVTGNPTDGARFVNYYEPTPVDLVIPVSKSINGDERPEDKETFIFTLTADDDASAEYMPANSQVEVTDAGFTNYAPITFTKAGTYSYTIKEEATKAPGFETDTHIGKIVVTVTDHNAQLSYTWTVDGENAVGIAYPISFTNEYHPESVEYQSLRVVKDITGNDRPTDKETFEFEIEAVSPDEAPLPEVTKVYITDSGAVDFGAIKFEHAGVYVYTVKEHAESATGYTYDGHIASVTFKIKDNHGILEVEAVYIDNEEVEDLTVPAVVPFTNDYTPNPVDVTPYVRKAITGEDRRNSEKIDFQFRIAAEDSTNPIPGKSTVYIHDAGKGDFGNIHFTKAGVYQYRVWEEDARDRDYACDKGQYVITYTITDNHGNLEATSSIERFEWDDENYEVSADGVFADEVVFTNNYYPYRGRVMLDKQGLKFVRTEDMTDANDIDYKMPVFEDRYLEGVTVNVYAAETIYGKDGSVWFEKDQLADTIVTTENGNDKSGDLPFGSYYLVEQSAPESYSFTDAKYPVTLSFKDMETVKVDIPFDMYNAYIPAYITVYKNREEIIPVEQENGTVHSEIIERPAPDAVFGLFSAEDIEGYHFTLPADTLVATGTTDEDGFVDFNQYLPHGKYYVKELLAGDDWYLNENRFEIDISPENMDPTTLTIAVQPKENVLNRIKHTEVTITKKDLTTSETVPGALIEVRNEQGEVVYREYTDENGEIPDMPLKPGKYTFVEVLAPEYYALNVAVLNFEVVENEDGQFEVHGDQEIRDDYTRVIFDKADGLTGEILPGVEFTLFNEKHEAVITTVSDENGRVVFEKIPYGTFTIEETKRPQGYLPIKGSICEAFVVDGRFVNKDASEGTIKNTENEIIIQKVDQDNNPLAGAKFGLFDESGKEIMSTVSDKDGKVIFRKVPDGKYTVRETEAVEGYLLCKTEFKVTIDDNYTNPTAPQATFINRLKRIKYIKTDTSGKYLEGVEFALINATTGETVERVKSDSKGVFTLTRFDYGDWIIREVKAPKGYNIMPDVHLHVDENWVEPAPFTCVDIPNHYEFVKTDNKGNPLPGVKFTLEDRKGNLLGEYVSDENGIVKVTNLTPGKYVIREIETLKGFTLTDEVIVVEINEKYVVPKEMYHLINYPNIQTGVEVRSPYLWYGVGAIGLALILCVAVILMKKNKKNKSSNA